MSLEKEKKLPKGLKWVKLGEVCEDQTGTRNPLLDPDNHFKYIDITCVDNNAKCILSTKDIIGREAPSRARKVVCTGDVIVSTTRPNLNAVALVPFELDNEICSTGFCVLRAKQYLDRNYLFAFVKSVDFVQRLSDLVKGALYPAVTDKQVRSQIIPLPPLPEQKRIAAILNEQMSAVEKARTAAEARLEAAKALPEAYLREVFESDEAKKWPRKKLGHVGCFESGGTPSKDNGDFWNGEIPFVTGADITELLISSKNSRAFLTYAGLMSGKTAICQPGTVLLVTRTRVGRIGIANEVMGASQDLSPYICGDKLTPEYTCRYLLSISKFLEDNCRGATIKGLTRDFVFKLEIPVPSLQEQKKITAMLNKQLSTTEVAHIALSQELDAIKTLPSALLRKAFNGEL